MPPDDPPLAWLFVDMNSFFASAEQHLRPELRGHPVGVVPVESEGTCVIAASREAKARGVRMGTGVREARAICPGIRLVRARPAEYVRVHHAVACSIDRCAPPHRAYSIDEWAIRLAPAERPAGAAVELARRIKAAISSDHSPALSCSIGAAPTRLLAKIACDLHKPDGLTVLSVRDLPDRLEHLELDELCGIGRAMAERLRARGVRTVRDLWALDRRRSIEMWGSVVGGEWWAGFHGIDEPEVPTRRHSMSHANVLEPRLRNEAGARAMLIRLVCRLGIRLREGGYAAETLGISVSGREGGGFSRSIELPQVQETPALLDGFYRLWNTRGAGAAHPLKVGAVVSGLVPVAHLTGPLFDDLQRAARLSAAMDTITRRWGLSSLYVGSMHDCRQFMDDKIAFGRIPGGAGPN